MVARRIPPLSVRIPTVGRHRVGLPEDLARVRVYRHHTAAKRAALVGVGSREDLLVGGDADLDDVSVSYRRSCDDRHPLIVSLGSPVRLPVWWFSLCADYNPVVTTPALKCAVHSARSSCHLPGQHSVQRLCPRLCRNGGAVHFVFGH
jgi:hypothetical protein